MFYQNLTVGVDDLGASGTNFCKLAMEQLLQAPCNSIVQQAVPQYINSNHVQGIDCPSSRWGHALTMCGKAPIHLEGQDAESDGGTLKKAGASGAASTFIMMGGKHDNSQLCADTWLLEARCA